METKRAMQYQTYLVSCWQEQDETTGRTTRRFRLEIPSTGEQHVSTTLAEICTIIEAELHDKPGPD